MPSAQMYAGISEGLSNVAKHERERPLREARVNEARSRQKLASGQLQEFQSGAENRKSTANIELDALKRQQRTDQTKQLGTDLFSSFDKYESDGDTKHLNNFLAVAKRNPAGSADWGEWTRFDSMTRTPETEAMLGRMGITDMDGYFSDPELVKSKVVGTNNNGTKELFDMNKAYQGSGYTRFANSRTVTAMNERAKLDESLKGTASAETNMIDKIYEENPGEGRLAAVKKFYAAKNQGKVTGSSLERIVNELMSKDENLSYEDAIKQASRLKAAPGAAEKDINVTADVRTAVHEAAGGDFYSADLSNPKIRAKVGERITDLEKATGKTLSNETKRVARKLNSMMTLGGVAGEKLSSEETGIMDNLLHGLGKYFSDNVEGVEGTAAYSAMRNVTRNALMGATLTPKELTEFDKAAGTLKQQLGPVLEQLKVQLVDIKQQIESVMNFEDPMMAQYYLGMSSEQADVVVEQLERRLDLISGYKKGEEKVLNTKISPKPKMKASARWKELTSGS